MKQQKYNWPLMVRDTMDAAFLPQTEMADKMEVSQQTVSNWLNGARIPSVKNIPELLKLALNSELEIRKYVSNPVIDRLTAYLQKNKEKEFTRLLSLYAKMSRTDKKKFIKYAEKGAKQNRATG